MERRGSPWGLLLIVSLVVICGIIVCSDLDTSSSSSEGDGRCCRTVDGCCTVRTQVTIQTDPPRGTVLIQNNNLGVAPVDWSIEQEDVFLMCVDWGSNPVCRRVSKTDLQVETYTFSQRLTP